MSTTDRPRPQRADTSVSGTGVMAIVVSVVAVIAGFFILRSINDETDSVTSLGNGSAADVGDRVVTGGAVTGDSVPNVAATVTPTTQPAAVAADFDGATVIVANANGGKGTAGEATTLLATATDFTMGTATDASSELDTSLVYYDSADTAANEPVAKTLARVLGGLEYQAMPETPPISGELGDAGVIFMLGKDLAEITLADLNRPLKANEVAAAATPPTTATTQPES